MGHPDLTPSAKTGETPAPPSAMVIFGANGDLTRRMLIPALYRLAFEGRLARGFSVVGISRTPMTDEQFRDKMREAVRKYLNDSPFDEALWAEFAQGLFYMDGDIFDAAMYDRLKVRIEELDRTRQTQGNVLFYLSTQPSQYGPVAKALGASGLSRAEREGAWRRIIVEKPFGHDLASAGELNGDLQGVFAESDIYRIDHYLGKETVQNVLAFRFGNGIFEPLWNRRYVDHVQITAAERIGVEGRGAYYQEAGALRDMIQNHLLQVLCLVAMEPPVSFDADEVRSKKVDVLRAVRPIPLEDAHDHAVRGQYGPGWIEGEKVSGYREEDDVAPQSNTETFAAVKLFLDNWRWQGVPFYLRTGKRLLATASEICIRFRRAPHRSFPRSAVGDWPPNCLIIRIQPDEGIVLGFQAKRPGPRMRLSPVDMHFLYSEAFEERPHEAYETLLLDVMLGDATLFKRTDQVEAAWEVVTPVLEAWDENPPSDFPNYRAGSWGPAAAERLIAQDGRSWTVPTAAPEETGGME
ncbi:MAG: glucose-6-phosphate dehydrogenase [Bryobacteraceae bacterium]|nr:glucose-6-phosphate dehydrogenase [Bryobacteraceae bacterium]